MKIWLNGQLVDKADANVNVFDHGFLYGDGVFEGIRIYGGRVFKCKEHLDRLYLSADAIRLKIPYGLAQMTAALEQTVRANNLHEGYIRLIVSRCEGCLGLNPFNCASPNTVIVAATIQLYPKEMYETGMPVIIAKTLRTSPRMVPPCVKSLNYLNNILARIESIDAGVNEAIMLNDQGNVAEATGDNIFIVKNGAAATPPPEAGILLGITRNVVIGLCKKLGIPCAQKDLKPADLYSADECFLTGTAAEIIPISRIDRQTIGSGATGAVTRKLLAAFQEEIQAG